MLFFLEKKLLFKSLYFLLLTGVLSLDHQKSYYINYNYLTSSMLCLNTFFISLWEFDKRKHNNFLAKYFSFSVDGTAILCHETSIDTYNKYYFIFRFFEINIHNININNTIIE